MKPSQRISVLGDALQHLTFELLTFELHSVGKCARSLRSGRIVSSKFGMVSRVHICGFRAMRVRPFPILHSSLRELNAVLSLSILLSSTFFELIMLPLAPRPISVRVRSRGQSFREGHWWGCTGFCCFRIVRRATVWGAVGV